MTINVGDSGRTGLFWDRHNQRMQDPERAARFDAELARIRAIDNAKNSPAPTMATSVRESEAIESLAETAWRSNQEFNWKSADSWDSISESKRERWRYVADAILSVPRALPAAHPAPETDEEPMDVFQLMAQRAHCEHAKCPGGSLCCCLAPVSDTRREDAARAIYDRARFRAFESHEVWSVWDDLVGEAEEILDEYRDLAGAALASLPAPPVVADIMRDINDHVGRATFEGGDCPVYAVPLYVVEDALDARRRVPVVDVDVIREFIVDEVGFDNGAPMTDQAERLAARLRGESRG